MTDKPIHILNQLGVLASFSVSKKVTEIAITRFYRKHKKLGKTDKQIQEMLKQKVIDDISNAIVQQKIPGLLTPDEIAEEIQANNIKIERIDELNKIILVIVNKLMEKKYNKISLCYFINSLVNFLKLTEDDFENFHDEIEGGEDGDEDDDDDEDDTYNNTK